MRHGLGLVSAPVLLAEQNVNGYLSGGQVIGVFAQIQQDSPVPAGIVPQNGLPVLGLPVVVELQETPYVGAPPGRAVLGRAQCPGVLPGVDPREVLRLEFFPQEITLLEVEPSREVVADGEETSECQQHSGPCSEQVA